MIKECIGCHTPFETQYAFKQYHSMECSNRARQRNYYRKHQEEKIREFVGVDGEGIYHDNGRLMLGDLQQHDYVLLSVGSKSLHTGKRLTTFEIFDFLYERFLEKPDATFCGYYLGYDIAHWLRDLPPGRAKALLSKEGIAKRRRTEKPNLPPFPVHIGFEDKKFAWEIDLLGTRRFKLRPGTGNEPPWVKKNTNKWMYITDVGSFFQMSFLKAIEGWTEYEVKQKIPRTISPLEMELIEKGKSSRARFTKLNQEMIDYNVLENDILGRMLMQLDQGFEAMHVQLKKNQWMGPGQAAQAWMKHIKAPSKKEFKELCDTNKIAKGMFDAARCSYIGGWFEPFRHGHVGNCFEYDVNSAYPMVISTLPCLLHGKWTEGVGKPPKINPHDYLLVHAKVTGSDEIAGAMNFREAKHRIFRPSSASGWYWWHELQASKRAGLINTIEVNKWYRYEKCDCPPPFGSIKELYQERLKVGKNSPRGKASKLVYNSGYGKMAQSIGDPRYANPIYASLIVCGCRVMILNAIATHPTKTKDLVKIATDGVYFRTEHTGLELSKDELGKWDMSEKENLTIMMPGLYWDDESRERVRGGKVPKLKSRGVPGAAMAKFIFDIDEQFAKFKVGDEWPSVKIDIPFTFIGPRLALARGNWGLCAGVPYHHRKNGEPVCDVKELSANPELKRRAVYLDDMGMITTRPYAGSVENECVPYNKDFGMQDREIDMIPTDGYEDFTQEIREVLVG